MNASPFTDQVRTLLDDYKARDVVCLHVEDLTPMFDTLFICTGTSTRHVKTIATQIVRHFKGQMPKTPRAEGVEQCEWVLIDLGDIIVHVMLAETRDFYRLEQLWNINAIAAQPTDN